MSDGYERGHIRAPIEGERMRTLASYLGLETRKCGRLMASGRPGAAIGSAIETATGTNPYYIRRVAGSDRYRTVSVAGYRMLVDTTDVGISQTMLTYGVHEYRSTRAYRGELERLAKQTAGDVTVLEVGANLGYFLLTARAVLGDRTQIYAVEPVPTNLSLLEHTLAMNGLEQDVTVEGIALGATTETVTLCASERSNRHHVVGGGTETTPPVTEDGTTVAVDGTTVSETETETETEVSQQSGAAFLADHGVSPASVNVVRMDVEGYECEVLAGLADVLEPDGPTLVFLEVHPLELTDAEREDLVSRLETNGFEIRSAVWTDAAAGVQDGRRWHGIELELESMDDLRTTMARSDHAIELIVRK